MIIATCMDYSDSSDGHVRLFGTYDTRAEAEDDVAADMRACARYYGDGAKVDAARHEVWKSPEEVGECGCVWDIFDTEEEEGASPKPDCRSSVTEEMEGPEEPEDCGEWSFSPFKVLGVSVYGTGAKEGERMSLSFDAKLLLENEVLEDQGDCWILDGSVFSRWIEDYLSKSPETSAFCGHFTYSIQPRNA